MFDTILEFLKDIFAFDEGSPLLFTQFYFWAFFTIVFAVFAAIGRDKLLLRNTFLFFVSVFFYYKTSGIFTLILLFATVYNFFSGKIIYNCKSEGWKRYHLIWGLIVNLATLCYFKYAYFLVDMTNSLLGTSFRVFDAFAFLGNKAAGANLFDTENIFLPVGISFFTFQSISYIMDIYRKRIEPVTNILDFGFYLTFFPQLVAGPIVRVSTFIPQLYKPFFLGRRQFGIAVFWILNGFAKKIGNIILELFGTRGNYSIADITDRLDPDESIALEKAVSGILLAGREEEVLKESIRKWKLDKLFEKEKDIVSRMDLADESGIDQDTMKTLTNELIEVQKEIKKNGGR
jgi:hypothetical protein